MSDLIKRDAENLRAVFPPRLMHLYLDQLQTMAGKKMERPGTLSWLPFVHQLPTGPSHDELCLATAFPAGLGHINRCQ